MSDAADPQQESLREFLDAEKSRPDPPPEVQQRAMSRLAATLGRTTSASRLRLSCCSCFWRTGIL